MKGCQNVCMQGSRFQWKTGWFYSHIEITKNYRILNAYNHWLIKYFILMAKIVFLKIEIVRFTFKLVLTWLHAPIRSNYRRNVNYVLRSMSLLHLHLQISAMLSLEPSKLTFESLLIKLVCYKILVYWFNSHLFWFLSWLTDTEAI